MLEWTLEWTLKVNSGVDSVVDSGKPLGGSGHWEGSGKLWNAVGEL